MIIIYIFILKVKTLLEEFLWKTKEVILTIIRTSISLLAGLFYIVRLFIFKILVIIMTITNIGFFIGLVFLIFNIKEAVGGTNFLNTKYFSAMVVLLATHIIFMIISIIVKPKE